MNGLEDNFVPDLSGDGRPESADGTLVIIVCRAKHLPNRRKLDKQSPYVTLRLGTTARKTEAHFRAGQIPEWTQEIRFDLSRDRKPIVRLDVLDETKNDPTPIGATEIDCSMVFSNPDNHQNGKYIYDKWYDLTLNGRRAGMIYLEMTFYPTSPVLPPKVAMPYSLEQDIGSFHNSRNTLVKDLPPPPPKHPSRARTPNVSDEVFVTSQGSSKALKRLSLFKYSQGSVDTTPFNSSADSNDREAGAVQVESGPEPQENLGGTGKLAHKFNKFKAKFQSKEPITSFWTQNKGPFKISKEGRQRSVSPISEYGLDNDSVAGNDEWREDINKNSFINHDDNVIDELPLPPPPPPPPHYATPSKEYSELLQAALQVSPFSSPTKRKSQLSSLNTFKNSRSIPFSADTIGMETNDDGIPSQVFLMDEPVSRLKHPLRNIDNNGAYKLNPHEIDPKYYAPTPDEHLTRTLRLQNGNANSRDLSIDLRTRETGYLGDGKFSPTIFDKLGHNDENQKPKPNVPPKIPKGLTAAEYYILEKERYLNDLKGQRL